MTEREYRESPFSVEQFQGKIIDIVHLESVKRVATGKKPADISDINQAKIVLERIQQLHQAGVFLRHIDDLSEFIQPDGFRRDRDELVVGGAFLNQCIKAYTNLLDSLGIRYVVSPLLTVRGQTSF